MGLTDFLKTLFEESEEELREEIKEAEKTKKEAEKHIKEIKKRKADKKTATKKRPKKQINKNQLKIFFISAGIILFIIFILWGFQAIRSLPEPFNYVCNEKNPCEDCLVTANCIMFEETLKKNYAHFTIINQNSVRGDCSVQISITKEGTTLFDKTQGLGILEPGENKRFKIKIPLPEGTSQTQFVPSCEWK